METPGDRIRQARLAKGWKTYREADRATGISRDNWANWETGRVLPSWKSFRNLAETLDVPERWLFSGENGGPTQKRAVG